MALTGGCTSDGAPMCEIGAANGAIIGGTAAATYLALGQRAEAAVVRLNIDIAQGVKNLCSGVVIGDGVALTAAHCVAASARISLEFDRTRTSATPPMDAVLLARHPTLDVALVSFASALSLEVEPIAPARQSPKLDQVVQIAGYGIAGQKTVGRLQFAPSVVSALDDEVLTVSLNGETGACGGDSGGPLLIRDSDGRPAVAGVLSGGSADCRGVDQYTRVDSLHDWILAHGRIVIRPSCGDIEDSGRCFNGVRVWCESGELRAEQCGEEAACEWDVETGQARCLKFAESRCGGVSEFGRCDDGHAIRCAVDGLHIEDCNLCDAMCLRSPTTAVVGCAARPQR